MRDLPGPARRANQVSEDDPRFYAPDGRPWCRFAMGMLPCVNFEQCRNPNHRITDVWPAYRVICFLSGVTATQSGIMEVLYPGTWKAL